MLPTPRSTLEGSALSCKTQLALDFSPPASSGRNKWVSSCGAESGVNGGTLPRIPPMADLLVAHVKLYARSRELL